MYKLFISQRSVQNGIVTSLRVSLAVLFERSIRGTYHNSEHTFTKTTFGGRPHRAVESWIDPRYGGKFNGKFSLMFFPIIAS